MFFLGDGLIRYKNEYSMEDNPRINKKMIPNKIRFWKNFIFTLLNQRFGGSSLLPQGSKGQWRKQVIIFLLKKKKKIACQKCRRN